VTLLVRRQVKIYVIKTGHGEPVEAILKIEKGTNICRISRAFLVDQGFGHMMGGAVNALHPSLPQYIDLKWSPKKNCRITPLTSFCICEDVKGSDCVVSKDEFKRRASKSRSWATFCKTTQQDWHKVTSA
jgi:hypothetical protein